MTLRFEPSFEDAIAPGRLREIVADWISPYLFHRGWLPSRYEVRLREVIPMWSLGREDTLAPTGAYHVRWQLGPKILAALGTTGAQQAMTLAVEGSLRDGERRLDHLHEIDELEDGLRELDSLEDDLPDTGVGLFVDPSTSLWTLYLAGLDQHLVVAAVAEVRAALPSGLIETSKLLEVARDQLEKTLNYFEP